MNVLVVYSLIILTLIRIIGVVVSLDFFLKQREERFLIFTLGWIFWAITGIFPILSSFTENEELINFYFRLNAYCTPFGTLFIVIGIILYFQPISLKMQITIPFVLLCSQIILTLIIGEEQAGYLIIAFFFLLSCFLILGGFIKRRVIKKFVAHSILWFYISSIMFVLLNVILILNVARGEIFGLYYSEDIGAIIVNYSLGIAFTALLIVYFIHTEQSLSSKALQSSEERFRTLYERTRVGLVTSRLDGTIIAANPAAATILGYNSSKELVGKNTISLYQDPNQRELLLNQLAKTSFIDNYELILKKKDGTQTHVLISVSYQLKKDTSPLEWVFRDITERKEVEKTERELSDRRRKFIEITSHELRTPLTTIKGFVDFLEKYGKDLPPEDTNKSFDYIHKNISRLNRLITDVSDLSQIERESFHVEKQLLNFCDFLNEVMQAYKTLLGDKFKFQPCDETYIPIEGDEERLQQVFDNLIDNSIKHSSNEKLHIDMRVHTFPHSVRITITDQGAGIEPQNLERIFEPFVSLNTRYSVKGAGIGLYLCRVIVQQHNGTISAQSEGHDQGTTITIELPLKIQNLLVG
ncbi:MAG: PAS domain S-box protein [Candidatus Heimdallarchaeota archaeon]|nr:MAG: PAS domain S-box protein [Candidatus Heimdallarchaeota archaeon]